MTNATEILRALRTGTIGAADAKRLLAARRAAPDRRPSDVAVIAIDGRFAGAGNLDQLWTTLAGGADLIVDVPPARWDVEAFRSDDPEAPGTSSCQWGGFIPDLDLFDPLFFNISPRDAELIDPQERMFLHVAWEVFEQAGYTRARLREQLHGDVGVFVGAMYQQYHAFDAELPKKAALTVGSYASMANRVSHFFDLSGPSVAVDTMCSSGAVAIDHACQSLRLGRCRMALAGAVNVSIHPHKYIALSQARMLATRRDRRSFSAGDGFIPAEVVAAVLLKPLERAEADGDRILAVIKSTDVRHKGRSEGFIVPDVEAETALLTQHFEAAGIDVATISRIECSASGAADADAVEFEALRRTFSAASSRSGCAVGSVKANLGHAEAAAGLAQLAKVVLELTHRQITPSICAEPLNEAIHFDGTPFYLPQTLRDWPAAPDVPRRASINTFGAGGTNCHMIVEEYRPIARATSLGEPRPFLPVFVFSAHSPSCLRLVLDRCRRYLIDHPETSLSDLAFTLQYGREAMRYRAAIIAHTHTELIEALTDAPRHLTDDGRRRETPRIVVGVVEDPTPRETIDGGGEREVAVRWVGGAMFAWSARQATHGTIVTLPAYPFERKRFWIGSRPTAGPMEPVLADGRHSRREAIAEKLRAWIATTLCIDPPIDPTATFMELGADSVVLTTLVRLIDANLSIKLKHRDLFRYRSIRLLADHLAERECARDVTEDITVTA